MNAGRFEMTRNSRRTRSTFAYGLAFLLSLLALQSGCKKSAPADEDKPAVSVEAVYPTEGPITEDIVADAILAPLAQAAIQAKVTAPIRAFYVQRGTQVKAGQLLATLEHSDLAAAALDNKGAYAAAQGTYTMATRQQVPQEETQARLDLEQARATLRLNQSILEARTHLLAEGAVPGRDVDMAKATMQQAEAAFQIAKQKFESLTSVGRTASIKTAEGQLTSAKGKYLGAEAQLNYTSIRTPLSGVVTDRPLFAGEMATTGTALVTVMDTSVLIAKLHLAQRQAQQIVVGAEAMLGASGIDEPLKAKVSLVSPALDPGSTTVEVWLRVDNKQATLKVGTAVRATIRGRATLKAFLIPAKAVQRSSDSGGKIVMVVAPDGTAHTRAVTLGVQTTETAQVTNGLSLGDMVITTGGHGLDEGTKVKVEAATAAKPDAGEKE